MDYNHEMMFEGIKAVWADGGGCHWCGRDTRDKLKGHDGFCPIPAMFTLEAELDVPEAAQGSRKQILENWQALLRVARAARDGVDYWHGSYDVAMQEGCASDGEGMMIDELRKALKEVEHLLEE